MSGEGPASVAATAPAGPLGDLPRLGRLQARLSGRLRREGAAEVASWLAELTGAPVDLDRAEFLGRAAGLNRPGAIAHLTWPRLGTRIGLGLEPPIAHAVVDRLLGFERLPAEGRLQVTPVEWGILAFVTSRLVESLAARPGALGPWDLAVDRVGPEPFEPAGLGPVVTLRWPLRVNDATGSARLWVAESVLAAWLDAGPSSATLPDLSRFALLNGSWHAEAGTATLPRGIARLRAGAVLPIDGAPLRGTPADPAGPIVLACRGRGRRWTIAAEPAPRSAGARLVVAGPVRLEALAREEFPMPPAASDAPVATAEIPVTLTVELGRLSLPLSRVADLRPGEVLELARRAQEPVDLTSGGKLVARGELVLIDTELGVRVTSVFL